ncbi:MAG TPA: glycerophosphodiester phosphodiesterase [Thermoanaerobaculia bacterium]|nr:glycerophosphodiester phosphodiesterase [Thermoanaerobaculia bacterium]
MLVLSHRGQHTDCPENTLEAFARAAALGADGVETDVRVAAGGAAVLFHDRIAPDGRPVAALTPAELGAAAGHPVPGLEEALDRFPQLLWNLEIKTPAALEATAAAVASRLATHRFLVTSFWHPLLERFAHLAGVECGLLLASRPASFDAFAGLFPRDGRIWTAVWHYEALDPALLDQAAALGFRRFVYGLETPEEHRRCADLGVTGVITDRVDFLR